MPRDVFVSYSQPDHECAFELVSRIEARGHSVWIAPRDITPSADWAAQIIEGISAARLMVLVFSSHSNSSPQVRREVERAVHKGLPVLPVRLEDIAPTQSLEYFMSTQHWLDAFPPPREPHYERLCAYLETLLKGPDETNAKPTAQVNTREAPVSANPGVDVLPVSRADLQLLESRLAHHVGPLAKHLVKRAAQRTTHWDELTLQLAAEIASDVERKQFIDACRTSSRS